jgi:thiamine pyrophosphate-dependent acetolactate synthase large subunit-like protein
MISRSEALKLLAKYRTDELVLPTQMAAWEWPKFSNNHRFDYAVRAVMGQAPSVGLGIALAHPSRKVWILNGDGSQLMHLGAIASIVAAGAKNIVLFVFENGQYEITGGQPIPLAGKVDFATAARGLGFDRSYSFDDLGRFEEKLPEILAGKGPVFVCLKVVRGEKIKAPKPDTNADAQKFRAVLAAL